MVLESVQLNYLNDKVRKTGTDRIGGGQVTDIWLGEFVNRTGNPSVVVIKIIRPSPPGPNDAQKLTDKLLREARVWTTLSHPNIVPLLGVTTAIDISPTPGLVTPYYQRGNLRAYVSSDQHILDLNDKMKLLCQVADALVYLHGQKPAVVHADIKPENVLIDDSGQAVLADFGLSVLLETSGFTTKTPYGTIHYMAPELLLVNHSGPVRPTLATDVWAFGITATEIFSRRRPYGTDQGGSIFKTVVLKKETLEHSDYPEIRDGLWSGLAKCWKWKPEERTSMRDLITFLRSRQAKYAAGEGTG